MSLWLDDPDELHRKLVEKGDFRKLLVLNRQVTVGEDQLRNAMNHVAVALEPGTPNALYRCRHCRAWALNLDEVRHDVECAVTRALQLLGVK